MWRFGIFLVLATVSPHARPEEHFSPFSFTNPSGENVQENFDTSQTVLDIFSEGTHSCRLDISGLKAIPSEESLESSIWNKLTAEPKTIFQSEVAEKKALQEQKDQDAKNKQHKQSTLSALNLLATKLSKVPGGMGALIRDYQQILNIQAYGSEAFIGSGNAGIAKYFEGKLNEDSKLQTSARAFYEDIRRRDMHRVAWNNVRSDDKFPLGNRASLADHARDVKDPNLSDGWVWNLALQHTGGDPALAMRMIGLCGHDDVTQGEYSIGLEPEQKRVAENRLKSKLTLRVRDAEIEYAKNLAKIEKMKARLLLPYAPKANKKLDLEKLESLERELKSRKFLLDWMQRDLQGDSAVAQELRCPERSSVFYFPGGLGAQVDIPQELKDRIIATQEDASKRPAGRAPGALLPAKYYHIMGSAAVACELLAKGHDPALVKTLSRLLGWAYRAQRINSEYCNKPYRESKVKDKTHLEKLTNIGRKQKPDTDLSEEESEEFFNVNTDAVELMRRNALGGQKVGFGDFSFQIPQSNFRVKVPAWLEKIDFVKNLGKPSGWSDERFAAAKAKMETWFADWAWTTEQHAVGGAFGAEMCSPENVEAAKAKAAQAKR